VDQKGGELYLVTARQNADDAVRKRLRQLGIRKYFDGVVFKVSKDELDFDVYIDDYPHLHEKLESGVHIMVSHHWNQDVELEKPHRRVSDVEEAVEVFRNLDPVG
jgi:5'(3')-deoxyribonucleotidase